MESNMESNAESNAVLDELPEINLPEINLPEINLPEIEQPESAFRLRLEQPEIEQPEIEPVPEPVITPGHDDLDWTSYTRKMTQRGHDHHPAQLSFGMNNQAPEQQSDAGDEDDWIDAAGLSVYDDGVKKKVVKDEVVKDDVPVIDENAPDVKNYKQTSWVDEAADSIAGPVINNPVGRVLLGGATDTINGLLDTADEIGQAVSGESYRQYVPFNLPTIPEGDSAAEGMARDITQFMVGYAAFGGLKLTGMGIKTLAKASAAGAAADSTFDPTEGNISTMLRELEVVDNSITRFFDSKVGDDASAEQRLRGRMLTATEGALVGAGIDTFISFMRWAKNNPGPIQDAVRTVLDKTMEFSSGGIIKEMPLERYAVENQSISPATAKNMVITHNLDLDGLQNADKMGGLAMPSLAVTKDTKLLDSFGEITLVAKPEAFDPAKAKNRFFNADIYSPRYPRGELIYTVNKAAIKQANAELSEATHKLGSDKGYIADTLNAGDLQQYGIKDGMVDGRSLEMQYEYLHRQGKAPDIPYLPATKISKRFEKYIPELKEIDELTPSSLGRYYSPLDFIDNLQQHDPKAYTRFMRDIRETKKAQYLKAIKGMDDKNPNQKEQIDIFKERMADPVKWGNLIEKAAHEKAREIMTVARERFDGPKIDTPALNKRIDERISVDEYKDWIEETYSHLITGEKIFAGHAPSGTRRYVAHTLDNVLKMMRKENIRGGEGFGGVGKIRAFVAKEFKSIADMQASRSKLAGDDTPGLQTQIKPSKVYDLLEEINQLDTGYSGDIGDSFIEDYTTRGWAYVEREYGGAVPDSLKRKVESILDELKHLPSDYFEGKIQGSVALSDFSGAVMPEGKYYDKAAKILNKHGITDIKRFTTEDFVTQKEQAAIKEEAMSELKHLFFTTAGAGVLADQTREGKQ